MNRMYRSLVRPVALAAFALGMAVHINAGEAPKSGATPKTGEVAKTGEARRMAARKSTYPFRGEVAAVEGQSIVLAKKSGTRPIEVSDESLIERDGTPIRLADVKPGDYLRGMLQKTDSGGESLVRASAGGKYDKPIAKASKATAKLEKADR